MSLLHATWLPNSRSIVRNSNCPALFLWADTWKVGKPQTPNFEPAPHPFTFSSKELKNWLNSKNLFSEKMVAATASLTLPSKRVQEKKKHRKKYRCPFQ